MNAPLPPGAWGAPGRPRPSARERPPLGRLLREQARLRPEDLETALTVQRRTPYRLGAVLTAHGWTSEAAVAAALAGQRGLGCVDLERSPPDPDLLDPAEVETYLGHGVLPWRRVGCVTTYAVVDPGTAGRAIARLEGPNALACVAVTTRRALEAAVTAALGPALARRAATRTPRALSVRGIPSLRRAAVLGLLGLAALIALGGKAGLAAAILALFVLNAATIALRIAALVAGRAGADAPEPAPDGTVALRDRRPPPRISLLVPLYREAAMVGDIVAALSALDYPRERLEVRLLLEADDAATRAAVARARLPGWIVPMVVPAGRPRTKPRALNFALDFCTGEIVGILDAEDRPEPGQLRAVAAALAALPPRIACVQCQLAYYNASENWLARCFQLEYSIWFDVLLRGWQALGLPIPLGGTSVYFRRSAIRAAGGWDAHNVTEDADLGMRLFRLGYRCAVLRSTTLEEANCRALPWIRQRSRWLKGYLLTWLSHIRAPVRLWREMGPRGFIGLNVLFLGAAAAYLAMPLFWIALGGWALGGEAVWLSVLPGWTVWPALTTLALGQGVMLAAAGLAMVRRGTPRLVWWVPTLPFYWTLGAVAAWKAVAELAVAPFWWDKTRHGPGRGR